MTNNMKVIIFQWRIVPDKFAWFWIMHLKNNGTSPDVSFTVGFSGEGKVTNSALEWSFSIMSAEMSNQRALVSTGVAT